MKNKLKLVKFNKYYIIALIVIFILGVSTTYSYYAYSYEDSVAIKGNVIAIDADLTVELVVGNNGQMVPLKDSSLSNALNAVDTTNGACVDKYGNLACQVYKITLHNNGSRLQNIKGTIELYAKDSNSKYTNLKWRELTNTTTIKNGSIINGMDKSNLVTGLTLDSGEEVVYYIAVYIQEVNTDQKDDDKGQFQGTVTFETGDGSGTSTTLNDKIKENATLDTNIDFSKISSDTNGKGVYIRSGTENDTNPIYYYRGDVDNNNLIFADTCWKIVRTTETGGTKIIYNGVPRTEYDTELLSNSSYTNLTNDSTYPYTYNDSTKSWTSTNKTNSSTSTISFSLPNSGNYIINYNVSSESNYDWAYFYKDDEELGKYSGENSGTISLNNITTSTVITVKYTKDSSSSSGSDEVTFSIGVPTGEEVTTCNNTGTASQIGTKAFNSSYTSPAHIGYMYGTVYTRSSKSMSSVTDTYYYGNDVTYSNGTYTLTDTISSSSWSSIYNGGLNNNHYTCMGSTTCSTVYYIYYTSSSYMYYISLSNGKKVEDALSDMLDNNTTSSNIKGNSTTSRTIDNWYYTNIEQKGYSEYLEDTVWCNDRSISQLNGWNPDGGSTTSYLRFGAYNRAYITYTPDLSCSREIDKFTVNESNGNGDLDYPVGLITADEIMLAGGKVTSSNSSYYLYTGNDWWAGSPYVFYDDAQGVYVSSTGSLLSSRVARAIGARPGVSLRPGTSISGGDGTSLSPFTIEN